MKKILCVSFAAMLAVSPMLANAAGQTAAALATEGANKATIASVDAAANTNVATTSYVKGAYNAVASEHNKVVTAVNNIVTDIDVTTDGTTVKAANSVAENLMALDTAVKAASDTASDTYQLKQNSNVVAGAGETLHHITAGNGVATNLKTLDAQVYANETAIGTNTDNISGLDTRLTTAEGNITSLQSDKQDKSDSNVTTAGRYIQTGTGVAANLGRLDTQLATVSDTVANYTTDLSGKQDKADSNVTTAGTYIQTGTGVAANLGRLDTQVKANADAIAAINNKVLPVYGTFSVDGSDSSTANVTIGSLSAAPAQGSGN